MNGRPSATRPMLLLTLFCVGASASALAQSPESQRLPVYDLAVRIVPGESRIDVSGQMTLPPAAAATDAVRFRLDSRFSGVDIAVVAPAAVAGPTVVAPAGNVSTVRLPRSVPAGTPLVLRFAYSTAGGWTRSFYAGADAALISGESSNWYPIPVGTRRATGRLRFEVPAGFTVAATGRQVTSPTPGEGEFAFEVKDETTFSFAAARHRVYRSEGRPAIALHLLKERPRIAERLERLRAIVSALETEFGPFPHPDLEIVEMPAAAAGDAYAGVSLEGFVVAGEAQMDSGNLAFLAHEIGHQWWADSVFPFGNGRGLLTEAMAQYGALRVVEAFYGAAAAREFRWSGYPGYGIFDNGRGYLSLSAAGIDAPLSSSAPPPQLVYSKGFLVHDLLARTVGRDRFRTFLKGFLSTHRFQDVTWQQFEDALIASAGEDLRWFVEQWYDRQGMPEWTFNWTQQDGRVRGVVTQFMPFYRAELDVLIEGSGESVREHVRIDGERTEFARAVAFRVVSVKLDPDYEIPHDTAERRAEADIMAPIARALSLMTPANANLVNAAKDVYATFPEADAPRHRFMFETLQYDFAYKRGDYEMARTHLEKALEVPFRVASLLPEMYYARAVLAGAAGNRSLMEESAQAAVAADRALVAPSGWGDAAQDLLARPDP